MNKLYAVLGLLFLTSTSYAGLITRTYTYTDGNTISANENNTNENTLYNEINGNISTANILDGTIQNGDIADTQIAVTKFASTVQSTFTYVNQFGSYRRPNLTYISATTVDLENNTGTSNQTCVMFPDVQRCVTENTGSTSVNRRFIITETASFSGTKNSGMAPGETESDNKWIAIYAVKVTDVSTDFVVAGSTFLPTNGNYTNLNTKFGTNAWTYLGLVRNGDNADFDGDIVAFKMSGNVTYLNNNNAGGSTQALPGLTLATSGGSTNLNYVHAAGPNSGQIPNNVTLTFIVGFKNASPGDMFLTSGVGKVFQITPTSGRTVLSSWMPIEGNPVLTSANSVAGDLNLNGWIDNALSGAFSPYL
jgi:hypothetical protein